VWPSTATKSSTPVWRCSTSIKGAANHVPAGGSTGVSSQPCPLFPARAARHDLGAAFILNCAAETICWRASARCIARRLCTISFAKLVSTWRRPGHEKYDAGAPGPHDGAARDVFAATTSGAPQTTAVKTAVRLIDAGRLGVTGR